MRCRQPPATQTRIIALATTPGMSMAKLNATLHDEQLENSAGQRWPQKTHDNKVVERVLAEAQVSMPPAEAVRVHLTRERSPRTRR